MVCSAFVLRIMNGRSGALQCHDKGISQRGFRHHVFQVDAEMDNSLRNLRANSADDAVSVHEACRSNRFQQVLGHQRIHRRHAGNVDNCNQGSRFNDLLLQAFHDHLRACAIERPDQRQGQHIFPQLNDRRGKFQ